MWTQPRLCSKSRVCSKSSVHVCANDVYTSEEGFVVLSAQRRRLALYIQHAFL